MRLSVGRTFILVAIPALASKALADDEFLACVGSICLFSSSVMVFASVFIRVSILGDLSLFWSKGLPSNCLLASIEE